MIWTYVEDERVPIVGARVERCSVCGEKKQAEFLERICMLDGEMLGWNLANTKRTQYNGAAYDAVQRLAQQPAWFLTLHGGNGRGKTRLLACLVNAGRVAQWTSVYLTTAELMDHLRSAYSPESHITFDGLWERIVSARILVLDEMDRFNATDWAQEKFFELIEQRYRRGGQCLTALATNLSVDALPSYVFSRVMDRRGAVHELTGPDWRRTAGTEVPRF